MVAQQGTTLRTIAVTYLSGACEGWVESRYTTGATQPGLASPVCPLCPPREHHMARKKGMSACHDCCCGRWATVASTRGGKQAVVLAEWQSSEPHDVVHLTIAAAASSLTTHAIAACCECRKLVSRLRGGGGHRATAHPPDVGASRVNGWQPSATEHLTNQPTYR